METSISQQVESLINEEKGKHSEEISRLQEAVREFELLVSKGLLRKRGNQLMSIEDMYRQPLEKLYTAAKISRY